MKKKPSMLMIFRYIFSNIIADQGVDKNTIANIYLWNSVILLFSILLMGYLFDKFGYRFIFVTSGFLILLICILVLFNNHNIYCIIASIFMYSLYKGCLRGKREAFMYNSLLKIDKINFYQRGMVMLYLFGEIAGIVGISLRNLQNDYHNIIYLQIFLKQNL
jgi:MFS family permease